MWVKTLAQVQTLMLLQVHFLAQIEIQFKLVGAFVVGFYRSASETLSATNATIKSAQLDEDTVLEQLRQISDGSFKITVDGGVEQVVSAVDF